MPNVITLESFFSGLKRALKADAPEPHLQRTALAQFFSGLHDQLERLCCDPVSAPRFNIFDFIKPDENRLSDIFADLLNPRGSHSHGDVFLRAFLEVAGVAPAWQIEGIEVIREAPTTYITSCNRRMDILIHSPKGAITIENKPSALDQEGQMSAYCDHMTRRYGDNFVAVYVSGEGTVPTSLDVSRREELSAVGRFRVLTYSGHIHDWLQRCLLVCQSEHLRWFLRDFDAYVVSTFGPVSQATGEGFR